jgi:hypothetical protein
LNPLIDQAALPETGALEHPKSGTSAELPLFTRFSGNPILTREEWPYPINSVFNAGAALLPDSVGGVLPSGGYSRMIWHRCRRIGVGTCKYVPVVTL